jgi:fatty acid desaturase
VAEHFGLARTHELDSSRNVLAPWYERMLFAPHNVHYHLAHHLVPAVPFYRLPRLQKILMESPVYRDLAHENSSYVALSARSLARDLFKEIPAESTGNNTAAAVKMGRAA